MQMKKVSRTFKMYTVTLLSIAMLSACQRGYREHTESVVETYKSGDYVNAAAIASDGADNASSDESDRVVYNLEAAHTLQTAGDYKGSKYYYDLVYEDVRPYLDTKAEAKLTEGAATTIVNQTVSIYRGTPGERIMSCTMNSINCLALGDIDSARVELNRSAEWQQYAKNKYANKWDDAQRAAKKEAEEGNIGDAVARDGLPSHMGQHYTQLKNLSGYGAFQNPFASHLRGVFLLSCGVDDGDRQNAKSDLSQAVQLNPACKKAVEPDLQAIDTSSRYAMPPTTWIYFMTGQAAYLSELRLDIPIPSTEVGYVAAAFPQLETNSDFIPYMTVKTNDGNKIESCLLVDMDNVVGSEFSIRLPTIVAQEITSSALKAIATHVATKKKDNGIFGLIAFGYQAASTAADLRSWHTMPKQVQVCRVLTPKDGKLHLYGGRTMNFGTVNVVPNEDNIVVVTLPSSYAVEPAIKAVSLSGIIEQ